MVSNGIFISWISQVKAIEKKDSVWTSDQQIKRLLRPGCTYFNLNPYEVSSISIRQLAVAMALCMYVRTYVYAWRESLTPWRLLPCARTSSVGTLDQGTCCFQLE